MNALRSIVAVVIALAACSVPSLRGASDAPLRASVNGAELAYLEQGSGETVVFLHGSATDYRIWDELRRRFGNSFRFVAYSRRHHAPNAWPDDGVSYTMAQHADDLVGFVGALGVGRAHIVAVSMGARVAAHAAVHHPEIVQTLTLSDGLLASPANEEGRRAMDQVVARFEVLFGHIRAGDHRAAVETYVDLASPERGWKGLPAAWQRYYLDNSRTLSLAVSDRTLRPPPCEALRGLRVPVLLLAGDRTPPAMRSTNEAVLACLPAGTEYVQIPRAAHYWYADNPSDGARLLTDFLRKHPIR